MRLRRWAVGLLVVVTLSSRSAAAQTPAGNPVLPDRPVSAMAGERLVGEALAGALLAVTASWGFAWAGAEILGPHGGEDPGLEGAVAGFLVGTTIGASTGVHLAARGFGLPASYWEALGGAVAGSLALLVLPLDADEPSFWAAVYGLPIAGAVLTSSIGSQTRMRLSAHPVAGGVGMHLTLSF